MLPDKLVFVDIETTGARSQTDRIIEIGILRVENNKVVKTYQTLLNPQMYLPPEITVLTGIKQEDVEDAPTFIEVMDEVLDTLSDCVFVAHNVRFDYSFLKREFFHAGKTFNSKHFCTVKLSRYLFPRFKKHNLDSLIERFEIPCENRHRALDDATVIHRFYSKLQYTLKPEKLVKAVNLAMKKPYIPSGLSPTLLENLPENPGVYIFYGEKKSPLYIGKSINIKDRVLSHFLDDIRSSTELKITQQIVDIETISTAGELGALFLESHLIKQMLPLYNRMLRVKRELVALKTAVDKNGYQTVKLETVQTINSNELENLIGVFKSRRQAKQLLSELAKKYNLCEILLGLEPIGRRTTSSCFSYRLGGCQGACLKEELPLKYNMRFIEAFSPLKVKPWPFKGPIVIEERSQTSDRQEYFLIDKWCFLGKVITDTNESLNNLENNHTFDTDVYKILMRYLKNPKNRKFIRDAGLKEQSQMIQDSFFA